jgi:hypothetical protein
MCLMRIQLLYFKLQDAADRNTPRSECHRGSPIILPRSLLKDLVFVRDPGRDVLYVVMLAYVAISHAFVVTFDW